MKALQTYTLLPANESAAGVAPKASVARRHRIEAHLSLMRMAEGNPRGGSGAAKPGKP